MKQTLQLLSALIAVLAVSAADADDRWLKKRNGEELYAYVHSNGCPVTTNELTGEIHELFIRSRIRPLTTWRPGEVALYVAVDCVETRDGSWMFQITTLLAELDQDRSDNIVIAYREQDDFGSFGRGTEATIRDAARKSAEAAFTKYLKANFDLVPD